MTLLFNELKTLLSLEGKTLESITYHIWHNRTNAAAPFTFIDKIEILARGEKAVILGVTEDAVGITVNNQSDDVEKMKLDLLLQFKGVITLYTKVMNAGNLWKQAIGQQIKSVKTEKMSNGLYSNEAILFEFEDGYCIEIHYQDDGLVAEFYEDV